MLKGYNKVKYLGALFLILIIFGEGLFRGDERNDISLMTNKKHSFYSNSNDVFTVLRIVNAMDDDKKIFIGSPPKDHFFDQLLILNDQDDKSYDFNSLSISSYKSKQLVLRKYAKVGTFYFK
jgi:hypothetical protein